jgi:hypothetical protein
MKLRSLTRLAIASTIGMASLVGLMVPSAHADTLPGNQFGPWLPSAYANGCSFPGPNLLLDQHAIPDPSPWAFPWLFFVNFRPACDMHDAGYSGGWVFDTINGGIIDTRGLSRSTIDARFFYDLITLCNRQIPGHAPVARSTCYALAGTYYGAVRAAGYWFFDASPSVPGQQQFGTRLND